MTTKALIQCGLPESIIQHILLPYLGNGAKKPKRKKLAKRMCSICLDFPMPIKPLSKIMCIACGRLAYGVDLLVANHPKESGIHMSFIRYDLCRLILHEYNYNNIALYVNKRLANYPQLLEFIRNIARP
jgi:hypothetical protein